MADRDNAGKFVEGHKGGRPKGHSKQNNQQEFVRHSKSSLKTIWRI